MYNSLYKSYEKKYLNQSGGTKATAMLYKPTQVLPVSQKRIFYYTNIKNKISGFQVFKSDTNESFWYNLQNYEFSSRVSDENVQKVKQVFKSLLPSLLDQHELSFFSIIAVLSEPVGAPSAPNEKKSPLKLQFKERSGFKKLFQAIVYENGDFEFYKGLIHPRFDTSEYKVTNQEYKYTDNADAATLGKIPVAEEKKASEKKALPLATAPQSNTVNLLILDSDDLETKLQKLETRLNIVSERVSIEHGRLTDFMYNGIKDAKLGY